MEGEMKNVSKIEDFLNNVQIDEDGPSNTVTHSFHSSFPGYDNSFLMEKFKKKFRIKINSISEDEMEFEMIGIEAPLANAFRRIMISEIPTMAIERIVVNNNTSIMADEILSHRIGLVPLKVDPRLFTTKDAMKSEQRTTLLEFEKDIPSKDDHVPIKDMCENEDLLFSLKVKCERDHKGHIKHGTVTSGDIKWIPIGNQKETLKNGAGVVFPDIVLCKLSPDQVIDLEMYACKGIGKTHAKWSPVSTAFYRLKPEVKLLGDEPITGGKAKELKKKCKMRVFDIEDDELYVKDERRCTMCRECLRDVKEPLVSLSKRKNHFLFTIESVGIFSPEQIFTEALGVFYRKCFTLKNYLRDLLEEEENNGYQSVLK